jgi:hypothetical protein
MTLRIDGAGFNLALAPVRTDLYGRQFLLSAASGLVLPGFAYSRSGPALWLPQQDGSLASFAADVLPRSFGVGGWGYEFHPGWTQGLLNTHEFNAWNPSGLAGVTQNATGPNGASDAWSIVENAQNVSHFMSRGYTTSAGVSVCQMAVVGALSGGRFAQLLMPVSAGFAENVSTCFDLSTGARVSSSLVVAAGAYQLANGLWLIWQTAVPASGATASFQIRLREVFSASPAAYQGDGVSGIRVWCSNITNTTYPVPLTFATTAPGVIGNHTMTATLSALGITLGQEFGVGVEHVNAAALGSSSHILRIDDGTESGRAILYRPGGGSTVGAVVTNANAASYSGIVSASINAVNKLALRVKVNDMRVANNGTLLTADDGVSAMPVGLSRIVVGHAANSGVSPFAGRLLNAYLIPTTGPADASLAAMTA